MNKESVFLCNYFYPSTNVKVTKIYFQILSLLPVTLEMVSKAMMWLLCTAVRQHVHVHATLIVNQCYVLYIP